MHVLFTQAISLVRLLKTQDASSRIVSALFTLITYLLQCMYCFSIYPITMHVLFHSLPYYNLPYPITMHVLFLSSHFTLLQCMYCFSLYPITMHVLFLSLPYYNACIVSLFTLLQLTIFRSCFRFHIKSYYKILLICEDRDFYCIMRVGGGGGIIDKSLIIS